MPRRPDLNHVLVIGSGPILIGQAAEFDYSGTQACRVLRAEGLQVTLINSNPATIMTDPEYADHTYVEPITAEFVEKVIAQQAERGNKIDALLATLGGQTALNTAVKLSENGALERYGVELIGADFEAIQRGEAAHHLLTLGGRGARQRFDPDLVGAVGGLGALLRAGHGASVVGKDVPRQRRGTALTAAPGQQRRRDQRRGGQCDRTTSSPAGELISFHHVLVYEVVVSDEGHGQHIRYV